MESEYFQIWVLRNDSMGEEKNGGKIFSSSLRLLRRQCRGFEQLQREEIHTPPSSRNPNHTAYSGLERFYRHARARSIIHHHHSLRLYTKNVTRGKRESSSTSHKTSKSESKTKQNKQSQKARGRIQKLIGFRRDANSTVVGSLVVSRGFQRKKKTKINQFLSTSEK